MREHALLHEHALPREHALPPSGEATVVLDIGKDVGAIVLYVPPHLDGREIDLYPAGSTHPFVHSAVRRRDVGAMSCYAAVYPAVPAGSYRLTALDDLVTVRGGEVSEVHLGG